MLGINIVLEILAGSGVRYIFGNPGSTELPLTEALVTDTRFQYIFALQEVPLTAMADGYAMASGGLGVACVHISPGLGNAMGMLYNAHCAGTPLLLMAGQQDRRLLATEPVLTGDNVTVARPWCKWAVEVQRNEDLEILVRRAVQVSLTPPTGPVFLSLPVDVQLEDADTAGLAAPQIPDFRVRPPLDALCRASDLLTRARQPAILAGSRVTEAQGVEELTALAETLGAPVFAESKTSHGRLPIPAHHPLYRGTLPLWGPEVLRLLRDHDVVFVVGMDLLRLYIYHEPACPIPEHVHLIHLDADPWEIAKNYPVEVGLIGDPKAGLGELCRRVAEAMTDDQQRSASERVETYKAQRKAEAASLRGQMDAQADQRPMTALTFMRALARVLPPDAAVIEEAVTTHHDVLERLGVLRDPSGHFSHRGWALGWGLGCAVGVKLAWPERPVVALLGDGAILYGVQGLWTAAHHHIGVTFVIANNAQYKILKDSGDVMGLSQMRQRNYLAMDLIDPEIDFVSLARAFGVEAHRVTEPEALSGRLRDGLTREDPLLLDVVVDR
jgi:benzoylformate decarboxylase